MSVLRKALVIVSLPLVLIVVAGAIGARVDPANQTLRDLKVFSEALVLVTRQYVEDVDAGQLARGAYQGLAESLDEWSSYYDAQRMAPLVARDHAGDVGLLLLKQPQQYVRIVVVVPGSPADEAALRRGQSIEKIDGLATKDLTLLEARHMLEGPVGTTVKLSFFHEEDEEAGKVIPLVRRDLSDLRVSSRLTDPLTAVLRVTDVKPGIAELVRRELASLSKRGVTGLVLDLRTNVGGTPEDAAALAAAFVTPGPLFKRQTRTGADLVSAGGAPAWSGPVVVLTAGGTVGEAELVAGALRDRTAARIVGTPTFGKRTQQDLVMLGDGSGLYLSVAEYRQANGEPFAKGGVQPDEKVFARAASGPVSDEEAGDDEEAKPPAAPPALTLKPGMLEAPAVGFPVAPAPPKQSPAPAPGDPQLDRAIEILHGAELKKAA